MSSVRPLRAAALCLVAVSALAGSQGGKLTPGMDDLFMTSKIGSFKILGADKDIPTGKLDMSFTGTVLITGASREPVVTGKLTKEYPSGKYAKDPMAAKFKKVIYHGSGRIVVDGTFNSAQWFGKNLTAEFKGHAIIRLYGEFDKDLSTGSFWYASDTGKKTDWGTGGRMVEVPEAVYLRPVAPKVRIGGG